MSRHLDTIVALNTRAPSPGSIECRPGVAPEQRHPSTRSPFSSSLFDIHVANGSERIGTGGDWLYVPPEDLKFMRGP